MVLIVGAILSMGVSNPTYRGGTTSPLGAALIHMAYDVLISPLFVRDVISEGDCD